jgi:nucleoside-diphosphate-sugar epimerase
MKVLLTGSSGFVGRHCRELLLQRGHAVVTTDRVGPADVVGDLAAPEHGDRLPEVDAIVHAAAVQYVSADLPLLARRRYFEHHNVQATRQLLARYAGRGVHMVNVATSMMYEQNGSAVYRPDSARAGQGVYSASKLAAQRMVEDCGLPWATAVPCIIGGEGREGLFRGFVTSMVRHGSVVFPGTGMHPIHMVHVEDVAALLVLLVEQRARGCFNAAAPEIAAELHIPMPRLLRLPLPPLHVLAALTGYRLLAREQLLMLAQPHVLDTAGSHAIGWQPRFDNAGIARHIGRHIARSIHP